MQCTVSISSGPPISLRARIEIVENGLPSVHTYSSVVAPEAPGLIREVRRPKASYPNAYPGTAWIAPSIVVPVIDGSLALGTWQSIVLVDPNRDNPSRHVRMSFLGD